MMSFPFAAEIFSAAICGYRAANVPAKAAFLKESFKVKLSFRMAVCFHKAIVNSNTYVRKNLMFHKGGYQLG